MTQNPEALEALAVNSAVLIASLMRELQVSDHLVRRPDPSGGKTQWLSARGHLAKLRARAQDGGK